MTKTAILASLIILVSCTDEWSSKVHVNQELSNFNNNPFEDSTQLEYGGEIFNSDFEMHETGYSKAQNDSQESQQLFGSCFCFLEKDTLQIYIGLSHAFGGEWIYNKIDRHGEVTSYYSQVTDTHIAERDHYQIDKKFIELNHFPVEDGDTLFGKILAEHELKFEDWKVEWSGEGNFKCIVRKRKVNTGTNKTYQ